MSDISLNLESFQIMEYWKIKKGIREILEKNNERISDRAEARVVKMSQKGYIAMMNNHTMTVKKLEEVALILNKPVSYFFIREEEKEENQVAETPVQSQKSTRQVRIIDCMECIEKDIEIRRLSRKLEELQDKLIAALEESQNKKDQCKCG